MRIVKERMSSYVDRGNLLIGKGKTKEAMKLMEKGLDYYSTKIINVLSPFAKSDAGMLVLILRHIADEIAKNNEGAEAFADGMSGIMKKPELKELEKQKKANRR